MACHLLHGLERTFNPFFPNAILKSNPNLNVIVGLLNDALWILHHIDRLHMMVINISQSVSYTQSSFAKTEKEIYQSKPIIHLCRRVVTQNLYISGIAKSYIQTSYYILYPIFHPIMKLLICKAKNMFQSKSK